MPHAKRIVFAMLHESGHLNPSFKLAKTLKARGHEVAYLAIPDAKVSIDAQGIPCLPLFVDLFPKGFVAREQGLSTLAQRRAITQRYAALMSRLEQHPKDLFEENPDLLVVDVTQPQFAFWARRQGVPFVYLNTSLPQTHDRGVPPLRSSLSYGPGSVDKIKAELAWQRFLLKRRASAAAANLVSMCPPYELARLAAARFGVASADLDWQTAYMPQLHGVLELGLCPPAFDFPRPTSPLRVPIASVDLERKESPFDWSRIPADKPLLYCALGGQRYRPKEVPGFFARLVSVLSKKPEWHLLLSIGKHVSRDALGALPSNVTLVESAPQLAVLRRAKLMITHAGLGSCKECILHGVPMLAVPLAVDQPANAARVVYHGLGLMADVAESSERDLSEKLAALLRDENIKQRVTNMRARFLEIEQSDAAIERLERAF